MTRVHPPCALETCISSVAADHAVVVMWEGEDGLDISEAWKAHGEKLPVSVVIGPEGGFSLKEIEMLRRKGSVMASLGNRILRSETAVVAASSVMSHLVRT